MAENLQKRPSKGILKNSSSFDKPEPQPSAAKKAKETKWDEMNIIATLHPPGKDYGHMKIAEPKTPYNHADMDNVDWLDANELAEKIRIGADKPPKAMVEDSDDSSDEELTEEERQRRREFEQKRKKHYNEFHALQLAKKLLEEDEDDEGENVAHSSKEN
ncbi:unnamed protein product [Phaedon cochleariae]|uniref:Protein phosphatase inhibitor 2 n=1 Tax=Phaedon cochleariae TaxID=80249 RepID=A0A9P0GKT7_PHACE|nr:unnamed protein product [Phaedon cochleariae]